MRKGIIRISKEIYDECWGAVSCMFKEFKPYHIEFSHYENDTWRFYGVCERFDIVKEGDIIPFYDVEFDTKKGTFTFRKL